MDHRILAAVEIGHDQPDVIDTRGHIGMVGHLAGARVAITKGPVPGYNVRGARTIKGDELIHAGGIAGRDRKITGRQLKNFYLVGNGVTTGVLIVYIQGDIINTCGHIGVVHDLGVGRIAIAKVPVPV